MLGWRSTTALAGNLIPADLLWQVARRCPSVGYVSITAGGDLLPRDTGYVASDWLSALERGKEMSMARKRFTAEQIISPFFRQAAISLATVGVAPLRRRFSLISHW